MSDTELMVADIPVSSGSIHRNLYIESYGCAMNFSDSEIVASILYNHGFRVTNDETDADVILINTCAVRDNAEQRIRERLKHLRANKKKNRDLIIGVLGCMAERLKDKLLEQEKLVDVVAGPDAYRELPKLLAEVDEGSKAINVLLSREETYGEISPVRLNSNGVNAFVSITRGCDNMCSFCVVPFTRGRERSREPESIIKEIKDLSDAGFKEVTLLGQNVDSYLWFGGGAKKDFEKASKDAQDTAVTFAKLLEMCAQVNPEMRIRFSTSHPKDIDDNVLFTMKKYNNICKHIHLPAQSGSSKILEKMNRTYDREWYLNKVKRIREIMPDCGISSDVICGFCTETEEDHKETLSIMEISQFDFSYMYFYSERPGTMAAKKFQDDVPLEVKKRRLAEVIELQNKISTEKNKKFIGKVVKVLVEGESKKSETDLRGRSDQNIMVVFPQSTQKPGDFVNVLIEETTTTTLKGRPI
ncbi:MAG: tRNA (N6-isopentenyl adenosine(37)-C2)-methylthiotransferase MiaB [Bacteroidia bacterium]|nr:tRNA (N6-isopentenyl adenosine(37)-C2)-methylthiotransferase MiaB [Bacteroidia bacterium]